MGAHKAINDDHPSALSLQQVFELLILNGLSVEYCTGAHGNASVGSALVNLANPDGLVASRSSRCSSAGGTSAPIVPSPRNLTAISVYADHLTKGVFLEGSDMEAALSKLIANADPLVTDPCFEKGSTEMTTLELQLEQTRAELRGSQLCCGTLVLPPPSARRRGWNPESLPSCWASRLHLGGVADEGTLPSDLNPQARLRVSVPCRLGTC